MKYIDRFFEKYAVRNLSLILIICYATGYILLNFFPFSIISLLTLDPYAILHGQVWRLITWIIVPSSTSSWIFVLINLLFYYSIGTRLEMTWGVAKYNKYIFGGLFFTILGSFFFLGYSYLLYGDLLINQDVSQFFSVYSLYFTPFYINMSIFLGYAMTYPEASVYLMLILPIKIKWLGYAYGGMLVLQFLQGGRTVAEDIIIRCLIGCTFLNFFLFFFLEKHKRGSSIKQMKNQMEYKVKMKKTRTITTHKCAICGRTDTEFPELEFRFCSKCEGNYEYCQEHLFTHEHKKK